jgi:hypothetical protein
LVDGVNRASHEQHDSWKIKANKSIISKKVVLVLSLFVIGVKHKTNNQAYLFIEVSALEVINRVASTGTIQTDVVYPGVPFSRCCEGCFPLTHFAGGQWRTTTAIPTLGTEWLGCRFLPATAATFWREKEHVGNK